MFVFGGKACRAFCGSAKKGTGAGSGTEASNPYTAPDSVTTKTVGTT